MLAPPLRRPLSTYRIQFTPQFGFEQAQRIIPYLAKLGISDLYASPLFQASAASTHGYDVNDYNSVSIALGGRKGLDELSRTLRRHNLGLLLDFVPNHMGIDGEYNGWWRHVLEHGSNSKYASYFDIEWHPRLERLNDRVLVPMLGDHYGVILESGKLVLKYENERFIIRYESHRLPIRPDSYRLVFDQIDQQLTSGDALKAKLRELGDAFENLDPHDPQLRDEQFDDLRSKWAGMLKADTTLQGLLQVTLDRINGRPGEPPSFVALHELLESQHYRLAHWKVGAHEVNYRRFFAVDTLVGLKMEDPKVFAATHELLGELIASGQITGVRLDHVDGLWNPKQYLERLAELVQSRYSNGPIYTLIEKILAPGEELPATWPVHGTSGYEFASSLIGVFLDRDDEPAWTKIYGDFTGETKSSRDLTYTDKLFALEEIFPNALNNLAMELDTLIEPDWHRRDFSLHDLKTALRHFLACLPVYRTYRMPDEQMIPSEVAWITQAVDEAIRRNPCIDPVPLRFVGSVVTGEYPTPDNPIPEREKFALWVCKLQQATGAVMAKSVEDTHFYRYVRMVGANEVGSHPSNFGQPVEQFHLANQARLEQTPLCMLTTSTHDTKFSEDARARLFALAELPQEWAAHLGIWHRMNDLLRSKVEGRKAPDAREEYLLYQVLLAAWPLGAQNADDDFRQRFKAYFRKAQGEAKLNTAWTYPHEHWHNAGAQFIDGLLNSTEFMADFLPFAERIAERGMIYSLAQTTLRLTSPGVPDLYQGNEIWDFSLVDPDNRRPVDFDSHSHFLDSLASRSPQELWKNRRDGGIKMQITHALLQCRQQYPDVFLTGKYVPLAADGNSADSIVLFLRQSGSTQLLVVVPRRLGQSSFSPNDDDWKDTQVPIPDNREWKNVLTGSTLQGGSCLGHIFADWPMAVFIS
jgi:(1->4)-alpha-D-glucan 1-alpha-D-glucosylmutase